MRAFFFFIVALVGCSSTQPTGSDAGGDGGDAACPSPGSSGTVNGSGGDGVIADPNGGCPAGYCWECALLDQPYPCNNALCLQTLPLAVEEGQCQSICDGGDGGDAGADEDASADAATD